MQLSRRRAAAAVGTAALVCAGLSAAATASAASDGFGYGTPGFVNSSPPEDVDTGLLANRDFAGEPSIGIDWTTGGTTGTALYQASNSTYKVSVDGDPDAPTFTWSDVSSPFSQINLDPILATHSATGTTMAGGDDGACAVMSVTTDDGGSWTPTLPCPIAADHPTVGIGPFHAPTPLDAVGTEAAYFCQQPILNAAPDECSYSHDGGLTWKPSVPDTSATACHSLFGHVKISPDGTAYIPDRNCTDPATGDGVVGGLVTTDNGQTLTSYAIPGAATPPDGFDPSVATDAGNRLYESWSAQQPDGTYHPVITWSDDHGKTWAPSVDLAGTVPGGLTAATFEAVVAGDAATSPDGTPTGTGRAAVAYLAAQDGSGDPFAAGFVGHWDLYVSSTFDGGATWQTVKATTDPVQIGEIDAGGTTTAGQRNLLDFMDASLTKDGRVVVAYADGCLPGCTSVAQSQDELATIAYQATGTGMFAADDTAAPLTAPAAPRLTASAAADDGAVHLDWTTPADGGAPITGYDIARATGDGAPAHLTTVTGTTSYVDRDVTLGTTYRYTVTATNAAGAGAASNEATATPTTPPGAPTLTAAAGKNQVSLRWTVPSDGGTAVTGYTIYRGTSADSLTKLRAVDSGTGYVDGGLAGGTTYYYAVSASNADGEGPQSGVASATPHGSPNPRG